MKDEILSYLNDLKNTYRSISNKDESMKYWFLKEIIANIEAMQPKEEPANVALGMVDEKARADIQDIKQFLVRTVVDEKQLIKWKKELEENDGNVL